MIHISMQFFGGRGSSGRAAGGGGGGSKSVVVYKEMNAPYEADSLFADSYSDWNYQTTYAETSAIKYYTGNGYAEINMTLREGNPNEKSKIAHLQQANSISSALSKFELTDNIVVFRGVNLDAFGLLGGDNIFSAETEKGMKALVGTTFVDKGFMSTSAVKSSAFSYKDAKISINVPKGKGRGAWVKPLSEYINENEFLLQKGSGLKITKVEKVGGHWEIQADLVGNGA